MTLLETIKNLASEYFDEVQSIRRHLHQNPELSMQEYETAKYITQKLDEYGICWRGEVAGTGIVGIIDNGGDAGQVFALRADMDALPIQEENSCSYASHKAGVMHACGHDVHMACLLGAAKILQNTRDHWSGVIKLIFQPSEETLPGGASLMIREGVLQNPEAAGIFGQHVAPQLETGKVGIRKGIYMASADEIYITVKGKGGHAATPHLVIDPVLIASHIIVALQQIVSRNNTPWIPSVLSFGKISGEGRTNVIPSEVKLEGTFRTFSELWRNEAHKKIISIARNVAQGMGGDCDVNIIKGYPFLKNDNALSDYFHKFASEYIGAKNIVDLELSMTSEDFAFYSQQIPACFYRLGTRNEGKGISSNVHTPTFDVDEQALLTGMGLMAWLTIKTLTNIAKKE